MNNVPPPVTTPPLPPPPAVTEFPSERISYSGKREYGPRDDSDNEPNRKRPTLGGKRRSRRYKKSYKKSRKSYKKSRRHRR